MNMLDNALEAAAEVTDGKRSVRFQIETKNGFLAVKHDHVDEFGDLDGTEFRIRENFTFRYFATTGHVYLSFVFSQINWECISIMKMRLTRS